MPSFEPVLLARIAKPNSAKLETYRADGGYEALRLTVLDDVRLGLLLRRAGKRTRGFLGGSDAECHWGTTVRGMIRIVARLTGRKIGLRRNRAILQRKKTGR